MSAVPPLAVGDVLRDNDPRMAARGTYEVVQLTGRQALICQAMGSDVRIAIKRIHLDGRPVRSGWSRVAAAGNVPSGTTPEARQSLPGTPDVVADPPVSEPPPSAPRAVPGGWL